MLTRIYREIKDASKIVIHRHIKPDGDALGSQMGLKLALNLTFPDKDVKIVGDESERYFWMGHMDIVNDDFYQDALVIVLDCGSEKLISDERYKLGKTIIKIDHHISQEEYGDLSYVDCSRESTSGIITKFIMEKHFKMNKDVAQMLYIGLISDTGRFRYNSTNSETFKTAAILMNYNLDLEYIYSKMYMEKLVNAKLKSKMFNKCTILPNGVAYIINTKEDIKQLGISIMEATRGTINVMSGIEEIKTWANFCEDVTGDIYCELRSSCYNVYNVAAKYGGGGHMQAAGTTVKSFDTVNEIINDLCKLNEGDQQ